MFVRFTINQKLMKNLLRNVFMLLLVVVFVQFNSKAQLPELTNGYPLYQQGTTFNGQTGYIDINGDNTNDFLIEYYSSGSSSYYRVISVNSTNAIQVEYLAPDSPSPALTVNPYAPMVKLLGGNETIASGPQASPALTTGGPSWSTWGYIAVNGPLPLLANSYTTSNGYMAAYLSGGYFGWAYLSNIGSGTFTYSSAAASSTPGSPITTPGAVPVPFIASLIGLLGIGFGIFMRKRKK